MSAVEVSCRCGAVRLRLSGAPLAQFYCHCDDCQAASGQAYVPIALYPAQAVTLLHGVMESRTQRTMPRHGCEACGTTLMGEPPGLGVRGVRGELLPPALFRPEYHIHCRYAVQPLRDGLPHYQRLPPQFGGGDERAAW